MSSSFQSRWEQVRAGRVRICGSFWAALMVSALPIGLITAGAATEPEQARGYGARSADGSYALAGAGNPTVRIQPDATAHQRAADPRAHGLNENVEDPAAEPKVTRLLENFVESNRNRSSI